MEPKIRLKGFSGEWQKTTLGGVAHVVGGGTPSTYNPLYWNGEIQWFTPTEVGHQKYVKTSKRTISKEGFENSSTKMIPSNSILLSTRATIGEASINLDRCTTNQGFQSLIPNNVDFEFLYAWILTQKDEFVRQATGSTFLEISANKVKSLEIYIPNNDEQRIIGAYFQNLDTLIQSITKKIESLKQVKAASLQSMFPQEGETKPRVRFKGFEGEWDVVSIDTICKKFASKYSENSLGENIGRYPIFGASGYIQNIETYDFDVPYVGVIKDGSGVGRSQLYPAYSSILGTMQYILPKGDIDVSFLSYLFETINFSSYINGSSIPHIYFKDYCTKEIKVPQRKEQVMIGNYFSNLDNQITLQTQRLEKLKQIKSACLDNMFV